MPLPLIGVIGGILGAAGKAVGILKKAKIIKDPESEAKVLAVLQDVYAKELESLSTFMQADVNDKTPAWVMGYRAMVRPTITYGLFGMYLYSKLAIINDWSQIELNQWDMALIGGVFAFWFGDRTIKRLKGQSK